MFKTGTSLLQVQSDVVANAAAAASDVSANFICNGTTIGYSHMPYDPDCQVMDGDLNLSTYSNSEIRIENWFPNLRIVNGNVDIVHTTGSVKSDVLEEITGNLAASDVMTLSSIEFNGLQKVYGSIQVTGNDDLTNVQMNALEEVGRNGPADTPANSQCGVVFASNPKMSNPGLENLKTVGCEFGFVYNHAAPGLLMWNLEKVGGALVMAENAGMYQLQFPKLESVATEVENGQTNYGKQFTIVGSNITTIADGFDSLHTVDGTLNIAGNSNMNYLRLNAMRNLGPTVVIQGNNAAGTSAFNCAIGGMICECEFIERLQSSGGSHPYCEISSN